MEDPSIDALGELVLACLDRMERQGPGAVEAVCAEHPEQAAALRARLAPLMRAGLLEDHSTPPERLGDFRLGERLGGGGMGVVYAAVQESLGREVALKLVRPDQLPFPEARVRFRREVELVARLQHPGIVPVYTVGEEGGVPFLAMERLSGATLAETLAVLSQQPRRGAELARALAAAVERRDGVRPDVGGALFDGSGVECLARIAARVAEALDHAHRKGVLHRDVKPSNLMLTVDGRVLLFDFGLASAPGSARVTTTGDRVGSLAYMSPEQARGEASDARTDVYGLGSVLCEALTLEPPYPGLAGAALLGAILTGDPVPLRRRNPAVPRDLAAIVHKALEVQPTRRYATALELARDLSAWQAGRPVSARRAGPARRAWRHARRHPARALALLLALAAPSALAWQQSLANRRVAVQRDRAEANLDRALDSLQVFLWEVGDEWLEDGPGVDTTRLRLLERAADELTALLPQRSDDPAMRRRRAGLQLSLGDLLGHLDRLPEAEACLRDAIALLDDLDGLEGTAGRDARDARDARNTPDTPDTDTDTDTDTDERRLALVGAHNDLANLLERLDRVDEALRELDASERELSRLGREPTLARRVTLARNRARLLSAQSRDVEALAAAEDAVAAARELAGPYAPTEARAPADDAPLQLVLPLGQALAARAGLRERAGQIAAARGDNRAALALLLSLASREGCDRDVVHEAAVAARNAATLLPPPEAEPVLRHGLELTEALVADHPDRPLFARTLGSLHLNLGVARVQQGDTVGGERWMRAALADAERLVSLDARHPDHLELLAQAGMDLATLLVQVDRRAEACAPAELARDAAERALARRPGRALTTHALGWACLQGGYGFVAAGEAALAVERARRGVDALPDDPMAQVAGAEVLAQCAAALPAEREPLRSQAFDALERGLALGFDDVDYLRSSVELTSLRSAPRFEQLLQAAGVRGSP